MMLYAISPIIGVGTEPDPYRAAVADVPNTNTSAVVPTNSSGPNIGKPKYKFAFCAVATSSPAAIAAVSNVYVFPDYNLDGQMAGMEAAARSAFKQSVEAYDMDGNGWHFNAANVDSESWRTVITRVVQQTEPTFNINNLNVAEVAG